MSLRKKKHVEEWRMETKFLTDNLQDNIMILFLFNKPLTTFYNILGNSFDHILGNFGEPPVTLGKVEFKLDHRLTRRAASF